MQNFLNLKPVLKTCAVLKLRICIIIVFLLYQKFFVEFCRNSSSFNLLNQQFQTITTLIRINVRSITFPGCVFLGPECFAPLNGRSPCGDPLVIWTLWIPKGTRHECSWIRQICKRAIPCTFFTYTSTIEIHFIGKIIHFLNHESKISMLKLE